MKSNKFWILIIAALFLLACIGTAAVYLFTDTGNTVCIYQHGTLVDTIHLDTVTTPYSFTMETENDGYNVIKVEPGRICVSEASCPDHVCINTGWLSDGIVPIVCLPNELVIQIEGADSALDGAAQ